MPVEVTTEGLLEPFTHGRGYPEAVALPDPSAGDPLLYTVTGAYWERLLALTLTLTTDANPGNRAVVLELLDQDGRVIAAVPPAAVQAASLARVYSYLATAAAPSGPVGDTLLAPLPRVFLLPLWQAQVRVANVQAGDQLSAAVIYRERFATDRHGYPVGRVEHLRRRSAG